MNKQLVVNNPPVLGDENFIDRMRASVRDLDLGWSVGSLKYLALANGNCVRYAHRFLKYLFTLSETEREASIPKPNQKIIEVAVERLDMVWHPSAESTSDVELGHYDSPDDDAIRTLHTALEKLWKDVSKRYESAKKSR